MSEDLSRDPLVRKLSQFTPSMAGVNRDDLLFAAGRASAPRSGKWMVLAGILGASQTLTLALLLTASGAVQIDNNLAPLAIEERSFTATRGSEGAEVAADSYLRLMSRWQEGDLPPSEHSSEPLLTLPNLSIASGRKTLDLN